MKRERIIEFVGGSEDEVAYLRLLLRKSARQLRDTWRLRRENDSHVDLLIIHDLSDASVLPLAPEQANGRRVRLIDPLFGAAGMESAPWPLAPDKLQTLLNLSGGLDPPALAPAPAPVPVAPLLQHNVYDDLFEPDGAGHAQLEADIAEQFPSLDFDDAWLARQHRAESTLTLEAEQLFRNDPGLLHKENLQAIRLHDEVGVEATDGSTTGGGTRQDRRAGIGTLANTATLTADEAQARFPLASYLKGSLLAGPSRLDDGHVVLVLDPRNREFYAKGALCIFEDCCKHGLRRGDWQGLAVREFAEVKAQINPRPYAELLWLCTYVDEATSVLAMGANTRYRLTQSFDLQRDYPRAARLSRVLQVGSTLASAALVARVPLAEAQRVAAAFDSVGFLQAEAPPARQ